MSSPSPNEVCNVLSQLVSDIAVHDEVRNVISAFAKANWEAFKASKATVELSKLEVLEEPGCGFEVAARVTELISKS